MRHFIQFILVFIYILLTSCSIHVEKRRYNPGYHVEVLKPTKTRVNFTPCNPIIPIQHSIQNSFINNNKSGMQKDSLKSIAKSTFKPSFITSHKTQTKKSIERTTGNRGIFTNSLSKHKPLNETKASPKRKKLKWIFGGISIGLVVMGLTFLLLWWTLYSPFFWAMHVGIALWIAAIVSTGITLYFCGRKRMDDGYVKPQKMTREEHKRSPFYHVGWILGGIAIVFAVIGTILAIIASSFGMLGAGLGLLAAAVLLGVAAFVVGFWKKKKVD